jgi:hypothetical protein
VFCLFLYIAYSVCSVSFVWIIYEVCGYADGQDVTTDMI